ncbi:MAG TPA: RraA family protein [Bacillota bacterium]|nr:RraA family protein [Bacillota bacterium]
MSTGNRIYLDFPRPSREFIEQFRGIPVSNLDDCMNRTAAVAAEIRPYGKKELLGTAFTVQIPEGDNLMVHKALDLAQPGDVLVVAAGGFLNRSIVGELMSHYCQIRGLAGIIIDGSIRDAEVLATMDYPVYARGVSPNGPYKNGPGEINTPICFAGQMVFPGDLVIGDGDGLLFINLSDAEQILCDVKILMQKEAETIEMQNRSKTYPRPWVDAKLQEIGCEVIDFVDWRKQ